MRIHQRGVQSLCKAMTENENFIGVLSSKMAIQWLTTAQRRKKQRVWGLVCHSRKYWDFLKFFKNALGK